MNIEIVFDSYFGNTEKIAREIGVVLESRGEVHYSRVADADPDRVSKADLLLVGSPTRAFRPTQPVTDFLKRIPGKALQGVRVGAFDTRISGEDVDSRFLKFMIKLFGYAAEPLAGKLQKKGGNLIISPKGFYVEDTEGPLKEGETARARKWAEELAEKL